MKDLKFPSVEALQIIDRVRQNFTHHFLPNKLARFYFESKIAMKILPLKCVYLTYNNPY
jgi:hypothetical protein